MTKVAPRIAYASFHGIIVHQMDVKANLNGDLK